MTKLFNYTCPLTLAVAAMSTSFSVRADSTNPGGPSLGVVVVASIQNPSVSGSGNTATVDGSTSYGGGLTTEFGLREGMGLEADLIYLNHKFNQGSVGSASGTVTAGYFEIPVLIRYRPIQFLNLGLGAYYSRIVSQWSVNTPSTAIGGVNYGDNDLGFVVAVGTNVGITDNASFVADLRYARSFKNSTADANHALKFADFQALAGVRFGF